MNKYICEICKDDYKTNLIEQNHICPNCRKSYKISENYILGKEDKHKNIYFNKERHMRFKDMYILCKNNYDNIIKIQLKKDENTKKFQIVNYAGFQEAANELFVLDYLKNDLENFWQSIQRINSNDLDFVIQDSFDKNKIALLKKMMTTIEIFESMNLPNGKEISLDIKLPANSNFTDFKKIIDDLEFIFTKCPFFQNSKESFRFQGVDIGSNWLTFIIIGAAISEGSHLLKNVAAFIDQCIIMRSHLKSIEQQQLEIERGKLDNKTKKNFGDYIAKIYETLFDNTIKELEETSGNKNLDGEQKALAEKSMIKLEKLFDKGLQMYTAIDSPPEAKSLFKPLEMKFLSIQKELKLLEDKENDKEETKDN